MSDFFPDQLRTLPNKHLLPVAGPLTLPGRWRPVGDAALFLRPLPLMDLLQAYQKKAVRVMRFFRWDLQLHFFWGFVLTLLGVYWSPLYGAGVGVTLIKEALDLWSKGRWSWDDAWCGLVGSGAALGYLYSHNCAWGPL